MTDTTNPQHEGQAVRPTASPPGASVGAPDHLDVAGAPLNTADVVALKPRRGSYLKAARDQGVHNDHEETIAFLSRVEATQKRQAAIDLADRSAAVAAHGDEVGRQIAMVENRFKAICDAYEDAGLGDKWFPFLKHLLFDKSLKGADAAGLFAAALSDHKRASTTPVASAASPSDADLLEQHRLNGDGLNISSRWSGQP